MRFRQCSASDLTRCDELPTTWLGRGELRGRTLPLWRRWLKNGEANLFLVEDSERASGSNLECFVATVFVDGRFLTDGGLGTGAELGSTLYRLALSGGSPVLSYDQIRRANSGAGLNLVLLHFALREQRLSSLRARHVLDVANAAFCFFHHGFRIHHLLFETHDRECAAYAQAGGFALDRATPLSAMPNDVTRRPAARLLSLRREHMPPAALNPLASLFHAREPRFGFTPAQQALLGRALLGGSDLEVAGELSVSVDAVKQSWRGIYQRVARVAPQLAPSDAGPGVRGQEKRRRLLEYLRNHLEELRPFKSAQTFTRTDRVPASFLLRLPDGTYTG